MAFLLQNGVRLPPMWCRVHQRGYDQRGTRLSRNWKSDWKCVNGALQRKHSVWIGSGLCAPAKRIDQDSSEKFSPATGTLFEDDRHQLLLRKKETQCGAAMEGNDPIEDAFCQEHGEYSCFRGENDCREWTTKLYPRSTARPWMARKGC